MFSGRLNLKDFFLRFELVKESFVPISLVFWDASQLKGDVFFVFHNANGSGKWPLWRPNSFSLSPTC